MKHLALPLIAFLAIILASCKEYNTESESYDEPVDPAFASSISAVYQGVKGYGTNDFSFYKDDFTFKFFLENGETRGFKIPSGEGSYELQNKLMEGYRYMLVLNEDSTTITDLKLLKPYAQGTVTNTGYNSLFIDSVKYILSEKVKMAEIKRPVGGAKVKSANYANVGESVKIYGNPARYVDITFTAKPYDAPVKGTPGLRTIKNLLQTAISAVGTTNYIQKGGWNWQGTGSSVQSTTIGVPEEWIEFWQMHPEAFRYKNSDDISKSYYPHNGYNEYHYAGVDDTGFLAWAIYNVMNTKSGGEGFVTVSPANFAKSLSLDHSFGTWSNEITDDDDWLPGDIVSTGEHTWLVIGKHKDGSLIAVHSIADDPYYHGENGSGPQLSAIAKTGYCHANTYASYYMTTYFTEWAKHYKTCFRYYDEYTDFSNKNAGRFRWHLSTDGLQDPDGYLNMDAEEILDDLFN